MALLDLLCQLKAHRPFGLQAIHFDHGLRPGSDREALWAQKVCQDHGVPCQIQRLDVRDLAQQQGLGIEGAGHQLRRHHLLAFAEGQGIDHIALGHHADDQAETFLLNLVRGSGLDGLTAMAPRTGLFWRPLLQLRKADLLAHCQARGLDYLVDPTNAQALYRRNLIRHQVLPVFESLNPQAVHHIGQASRLLQDDRALLEAVVAKEMATWAQSEEDSIRFRKADLKALPWPLVRRMMRQGAAGLCPGKVLNQKQLDQVQAFVDGQAQGQADLGGGLIVWSTATHVSLEVHQVSIDHDRQVVWDMTAPLDWPGFGTFSCQPGGYEASPDKYGLWLPQARPFLVRHRWGGDRIVLAGLGHKQVKDLFRAQGISLAARKSWPIFCDPDQGDILWIPGLAISSHLQERHDKRGGILIKSQNLDKITKE